MSFLSYIVPRKIAESGSRFNNKIEVIESFGATRLLVNGVVQTGEYTQTLFKNGLQRLSGWHLGPMNRILVFGIGGGGVFFQLRTQYPDAHLIGVDIDPEIIALAQHHFGIQQIGNTSFVCSDALTYAQTRNKNTPKFDCVIVDIYIGNDVPDFVTSNVFLKALRRLMRPNGSLIINYFSESDQEKKAPVLLLSLKKICIRAIKERNQRNIFFYCTA